MDFPAELRLCLYEHVIGSYVWTSAENDFTTVPQQLRNFRLSKNYFIMRDPLGLPPPAPACANILRISRTVNAEAVRVVWESTWKHFCTLRHLAQALLLSIPPPYNWLRRLSISFFNYQYLDLLGMRSTPTNGFAPLGISPYRARLRPIARIPTLIYLNLHFTLFERGTDNPRTLTFYDPWPILSVQPATFGRTEWISCQKVFVDWFFTLAFDAIRDVPHITFSGHVKDSTRLKWEHIFIDEKRRRNTHVLTQKALAITSIPRNDL
jgi:hypothetical protein